MYLLNYRMDDSYYSDWFDARRSPGAYSVHCQTHRYLHTLEVLGLGVLEFTAPFASGSESGGLRIAVVGLPAPKRG
jgi:hypothetical protein